MRRRRAAPGSRRDRARSTACGSPRSERGRCRCATRIRARWTRAGPPAARHSPAERSLDVGDRQRPRCERLTVDPDPHRLPALAADIDARDARRGGQLVEQHPLGIVGQFQHRHAVAGQVEVHDRLAEGLGLLDLGRIRLLRQVVDDPPDAVADVVGGRVHVAIGAELDIDRRAAVAGTGTQRFNSLEARNAVLDHLRDLVLDDHGACAQVIGLDRHEHRIDFRVLADCEPGQGNEAQDHQQQADDRREHRPPDREFRELHRSGRLA